MHYISITPRTRSARRISRPLWTPTGRFRSCTTLPGQCFRWKLLGHVRGADLANKGADDSPKCVRHALEVVEG